MIGRYYTLSHLCGLHPHHLLEEKYFKRAAELTTHPSQFDIDYQNYLIELYQRRERGEVHFSDSLHQDS